MKTTIRIIHSTPSGIIQILLEAKSTFCQQTNSHLIDTFLTSWHFEEWNVRLGDFSRGIAEVEDAVEVYRSMDSPQAA